LAADVEKNDHVAGVVFVPLVMTVWYLAYLVVWVTRGVGSFM